MTPNHPIPPERIRAEAERVVNEWGMKYSETGMWQGRSVLSQDRFAALVAAGASLVDVSAVQREAFKVGWNAALDRALKLGLFVEPVHMVWSKPDDKVEWSIAGVGASEAARKAYPAPAPRECVLSDGSVVTVHDGMFKRYGSTVGHITTRNWRDLADTGADFDALKQFAERAK